MGRNPKTAPAAFSPDWPRAACSDLDAEAVRQLVLTLGGHVGKGRAWTVRGAATAAGIDHSRILRLMTGESWPEARTIFRLERALGQVLWPQHLERPDE